MKQKTIIVLGGIVCVGLIFLGVKLHRQSPSAAVFGTSATTSQSTALGTATFAQCLKDNGAVFYGAFWCPHCQAQKALFGNSAKLLPYVECSNPDGQTQTKVCNDRNITGYPTWEFADGSRVSGEQTFATLAEKTGCPVPTP